MSNKTLRNSQITNLILSSETPRASRLRQRSKDPPPSKVIDKENEQPRTKDRETAEQTTKKKRRRIAREPSNDTEDPTSKTSPTPESSAQFDFAASFESVSQRNATDSGFQDSTVISQAPPQLTANVNNKASCVANCEPEKGRDVDENGSMEDSQRSELTSTATNETEFAANVTNGGHSSPKGSTVPNEIASQKGHNNNVNITQKNHNTDACSDTVNNNDDSSDNLDESVSNAKILKNQKKIMKMLTKLQLQQDSQPKKGKQMDAPEVVPDEEYIKKTLEIRDHVHRGYKEGKAKKLSWTTGNKLSLESPENSVMTEHLRVFAHGLCPEDEKFSLKCVNQLIQKAIKRYFTTQMQRDNRIKNNKAAFHNKRQAIYERKKNKLAHRMKAVGEMDEWSDNRKKTTLACLTRENMSSEEENPDGSYSMLVTRYKSHSKKWRQRLKKLDKKAYGLLTARGRARMAPRIPGKWSDKKFTATDDTMWMFQEVEEVVEENITS